MTETAIDTETLHAPLSVGIQMIPIGQFVESSKNPRRHFPAGPPRELADSMRQTGFHIYQPITGRPIDLGNGHLVIEIGAGHRRIRAAREAGIELIPCIVREMSDEEFSEILNFDNSAREDVHPLDEAAGWDQWMQDTGKGVDDIAARIGQSKEYVYQRLKVASLTEEAKKAFLDDEIKLGHAVQIARLQPTDQKTALDFYRTGEWDPRATGYRRPSVRQLADFIARNIHLQMDAACFDLSSATLLPTAGACTVCPKRTRNAPELLLQIEQAADPNRDECTDPGCFNAKVTAHFDWLQKKYEAEGARLLKVSSGLLTRKGADYGKANFETISASPFDGALPGVWMDGPNIGRVIYVQLVQPAAPVDDSARLKAEAERKKKEDERRRVEQEQIRLSEERQRIAEEARRKIELANNKKFEKERAKLELEKAFRRETLDAISTRVTNVSRVDVEALLCDYLINAEMSADFIRIFGERFDQASRAHLDKELSRLSDADIYRMAVLLPLFVELDDFQLDRPADLLLAAAKRYKVDSTKIRIQVEGKSVNKPFPEKSTKKAKPAAKKAPAKKGGKKTR